MSFNPVVGSLKDVIASCLQSEVGQCVAETGTQLTFVVRDESHITRGRYNSIKRRTHTGTPPQYSVYSFPFNTNPSKKEIERTGVAERADGIAYTSQSEWDSLNINVRDIDIIRTTVWADNVEYEISDKVTDKSFMGKAMYVIFGLVQK